MKFNSTIIFSSKCEDLFYVRKVLREREKKSERKKRIKRNVHTEKKEIKNCAVGYFALTQLLIYVDKIYCLQDLELEKKNIFFVSFLK